jgi:hypothetical protein
MRRPVSGFFTMRTLFQTIRPSYIALFKMPEPRFGLPSSVDGRQSRPRGGLTPSPEISRSSNTATTAAALRPAISRQSAI